MVNLSRQIEHHWVGGERSYSSTQGHLMVIEPGEADMPSGVVGRALAEQSKGQLSINS